MTIAGSAGDDHVTVEVVECGRAIRVWVPAEARTLHLVQAAMDDNMYSTTVDIEGYAATFTLFRSDARKMEGTYTVETPDADLYAEIALELNEAFAPTMAGCFDDREPQLETRGTSQSYAALADALVSTGRALPAEADFGDYISAEGDSASGMEAVYVRLGADGNILPSIAPELSTADICAGQSSTAEPPVHLLRFRVFTFERTTTVFVQRNEIETGRIIEQREGAASGQNQSSVKVAMLMAMSELSSKPSSFAPVER